MTYLIAKYVGLALQYGNNTPEELFNHMIKNVSDEEARFMADNFVLFLKSAEHARNAPPEIKEVLRRTQKGE